MTAWDLSGKKFGRLTVIKRVDNNVLPSGLNEPMWLCHCSCGNNLVVRGAFLRTGHTKSCGCLKHRYRDLTNQRFGRVIAIRPVGCLQKTGGMQWLCRCDCGKLFVTRGSALTTGHTKSCGCFKKQTWWKSSKRESNAELVIGEFLSKSGLKYKSQVHFSDLVNDQTGYSLSYDFEIFSPIKEIPSLLVEIQGPQHYFSFNWAGGIKTFQNQHHKDILKFNYVQAHKELLLYEIPNPKGSSPLQLLNLLVRELHNIYDF